MPCHNTVLITSVDLMGDVVTLFFYTLSRRPSSKAYPYGYGKFESLGTVSSHAPITSPLLETDLVSHPSPS